MIRLLLCDDHVVFADALAMALGARGEQVVAIARTVPSAVAEARANRPDLAVMDLHFSDGPDGLAGIRALAALDAPPRIVLLSGAVDGRVLTEAVRAGANGVVSKAESLDSVLRALQLVAAGGFYADPDVVRRSLRPSPAELDEVQLSAQFLTPREREVLARLVQGSSTTELAEAMGVGAATIRTHVQAVLSKLGVSSRLEAVTLAIAHGLHEPPQRRLPSGT